MTIFLDLSNKLSNWIQLLRVHKEIADCNDDVVKANENWSNLFSGDIDSR